MTAELERQLRELGVIPRPAPRQDPPPPLPDPIRATGVWYSDGNIPH